MSRRHRWSPWVLLLLAGCGRPGALESLSDDAVSTLFKRLHEPVYRVYDLGADRDAIHQLLASSFDGEALTEQYIEHFTTLVRMGREQTSIRVVRVDYERVEIISRRGTLRLDADWSVGGIVSHQQHRHLRTNRYRAIYDLAATDRGWRIVGTRLRDLQRVQTGLGLKSTDLPTSAGGLMSPLDLLRAGLGDELPDEVESGQSGLKPGDTEAADPD